MGAPRGKDGTVKEYASAVQDVLDAANQELFSPSREAARRPFGRVVERKPVFSKPLAGSEKLTLKSTFALPVLDASSSADAVADQLTGYETAPYKPLRLPHR